MRTHVEIADRDEVAFLVNGHHVARLIPLDAANMSPLCVYSDHFSLDDSGGAFLVFAIVGAISSIIGLFTCFCLLNDSDLVA